MVDSTRLYDTFGNETKTRLSLTTLEQYLENATVKFALPEASAQILSELVPDDKIDPTELEAVESALVNVGFQKPNAKAMATVLIKVAKEQGVSPFEYFSNAEAALRLAIDTYAVINALRPAGNKIGLASQVLNSQSRFKNIIKP